MAGLVSFRDLVFHLRSREGNVQPRSSKRQKELSRLEKRKEKDERREQRKKEKEERPPVPEGEDPDIAGIVPGPQPKLEDDF